MKELYRTNNPVEISWMQSMLAGEGIDSVVFDMHTSIIEGSISAIARRLMVADEDYARARHLIDAAPADEPVWDPDHG